jgi:DNA repair exonuclease SbcCD ATPase subunit
MDAGFNEDLKRIETKVDKLTDAVTRLILVEERQTAQGVRIDDLEEKTEELDKSITRVDRKVERWVNIYDLPVCCKSTTLVQTPIDKSKRIVYNDYL